MKEADDEKTIFERIESMPHEEMARLYRFAPSGHILFREPYWSKFVARFNSLGGFTPEISKEIGWGENG